MSFAGWLLGDLGIFCPAGRNQSSLATMTGSSGGSSATAASEPVEFSSFRHGCGSKEMLSVMFGFLHNIPLYIIIIIVVIIIVIIPLSHHVSWFVVAP